MLTGWLRSQSGEKIRFLVGGCYNTAFGYGVFALLYTLLHRHLFYVVILAMAQAVSLINNYLVYRLFVFQVRGHVVADGLRFSSVYLSAYATNLAALPVLVHFADLDPLVAQAVLVLVTAVSCYLAHRYFSFRRRPEMAPVP
jgi:putative flippase GtrA